MHLSSQITERTESKSSKMLHYFGDASAKLEKQHLLSSGCSAPIQHCRLSHRHSASVVYYNKLSLLYILPSIFP